ncbi:TRAP-type C4-dicarboxylate transport system, small permease component DctQ [Reinekea forsetii]|jgi:TRAP-type C4-dicarboxylate transport system permease small subunit|uniref:TRAP transporter small permease protein n=1 Tax=Reinekea forsetii TaxID=1336806 RepID=A0A2K8KNA0_9GAMM|nr:TRAP-type C4-dicarboxylate transport system, small permease component DctQ [Reinekea forsetii]
MGIEVGLLKKIGDFWALTERMALVAVLLSMIGFAVLQIVLRNVFDSSLFWIDPLNRLLVLWLAILGAMVATREQEHISIDVLRHYASGVGLLLLVRLTSAFAALVCGLMTYHSARFVYYEMIEQMPTFSNLPAWPFELIMPLGFLVMTLRFALAAIIPKQVMPS